MSLPDRRCFGTSRCIHIGPCCDFWADYGMCVCNPVDASSYPTEDRIYIAANIGGLSNPNINCIFDDGYEEAFYERGDYMYVWWDFGGYGGKVTFQLRDGSSVKYTRTTTITGGVTPEPDPEPDPYPCQGVNIVIHTRDNWCTFSESGEMSLRASYQNTGTVGGDISMKMYVNGIVKKSSRYVIVPRATFSQSHSGMTFTGDTATIKFVARCNGEIIDEVTKTAVKDVYVPPQICNEGDKRSPETCWNDSIIHKERCLDNEWVYTGEECPDEPIFVCNEGELRYGNVCSDGSTIYAEVCKNNAWVPTGDKCSEEPEPDPETETDWITYILIGVAVIIFYFLAKRG